MSFQQYSLQAQWLTVLSHTKNFQGVNHKPTDVIVKILLGGGTLSY